MPQGCFLRTLAVILASTLIVLGSERPAFAASTKVVFAYATPTPRAAVPLWIAQERGFFQKHGVDVETVLVRSASVLMSGLAAGDIKIASTGGSSVLTAAGGGLDVRIVANFASKAEADLIVRPGIRNPLDLRGGRFGVQSIGGTVWLFAMLGLEHLGLDALRDRISVMVLGDQPVLSQALEARTIDASVFTTRVFSRELRKKGFQSLAELNKPVAGGSIVVRQSYLQQNRGTVTNVLKGILEGAAFALNPTNRSLVFEMITKRLGNPNPAFIVDGYNEILRQLDRKPYPSLEGLKNIQRLIQAHNPRLLAVKVEDLVDNQIIRSLDESGFIDGL